MTRGRRRERFARRDKLRVHLERVDKEEDISWIRRLHGDEFVNRANSLDQTFDCAANQTGRPQPSSH